MLISPDDLSTFDATLDVQDNEMPRINRLIESASEAITTAAGCPIVKTRSTITLLGGRERLLNLPGTPIREVHSVLIDGVELPTGKYRVASAGIYHPGGWAHNRELPEITIDYTHGFDTVPADIAALAASMVIAGLIAAREGGWELHNGNISSIRIDDYQESRATSGEGVESVTPMSLPDRTRQWLSTRFGGGAVVQGSL